MVSLQGEEDLVGRSGGGTVCALGKNAAFDSIGIAAGDLILSSGGHQDFAICKHQLSRIGGFGF